MKRSYEHLDVFADEAFHGNQLAVFTDAAGLDADRMQRIAREMAFSETTFVFPRDSADADVPVRIFTPSRELPMAGHPTIGTAFALATSGFIAPGTDKVTLALGVGPTPVFLEWDSDRLSFAWMRQPVPVLGFVAGHIERLATGLGIDDADIAGSGLPVQQVSSGVPFLFVPVATRSAVDHAAVDRAALQDFFEANGQPEHPVFLFTLERGKDDATAYSRMFAPLFGIPEDPATGGASGPLGAFLLHYAAVSPQQATRMISLQGVSMGRPSRITISVSTRDDRISEVRVGGTCVSVGTGFLNVPEARDRSS